ncbi:multiple epidermal growth factor-like domains protein 8 [Folsomia candida]|uniref:multiple epidermal growth factor-like domains protein 8 n=1 Tax=Folsomia candida TaxID=158441 RepID=UPI001604A4C7|nr:multiple epidermal growth factor-like domains protein 8 [Folsomia candida]
MNLILLLLFFGLQDSTGEPPTHTPPESENPSRNDNQHLTWAHMDSVYMLQPCNKSREVIQNSWGGTISDGPLNYTQDTHCEWLIKAPPGYWISLKVDQIRTECSYDFLFVIDGMSYVQGQSKLLASFSGASNPHVNILAQSGYMLILLYSDPNYALEGFLAEYSISPCPLNCSNVGECVQIQTQNVCKCGPQRSGVGCEKIKSNNETFSSLSLLEITESYDSSSDDEYEDTQVLLASSWNSVLARVGHSMIQLNANHTYIFGGFDLNTLLDNLIILDLYNGTIQKVAEKQDEQTEKESERVVISPSGRFAHAAVRFKTGFFIHGGKTEVGVSNDLFYYNATNGRWSQLIPQANQSTIPKLMYHSMTLTPSGHIYVFGGAKSSGKFSSTLYQFHGDSPTNWTIVKSSCCGKETHRSYLGHTMSYWPQKNSLILFGGIGTSDYGRFSKLSSQLWIFMLNSTTWLHLDYKKNGGVPPGIYLERAFHTAHIVEQYLIIFGGYTHVHNKDETCYSNQMLVYNLECQIFLPITPPSASSSVSSSSEYRATRGLFGHQSVIVDDYLLIVGGYRGYLSQSVRKIPFPFTKSKSSRCSSFDRWRCSGEPQCGWCPTNGRCFDKLTGAANCTTNLQTAQCPGICPLLTSCQSCTSAFPGCVWCGTLEQCWKQTLEEVGSRTNVCNNPLDKSSQTSVVQCAEKSWRMGLTQFEHRFPPNFSNPDAVKVINSSVLIISREYGSTIPVDTPVTFALRGSLLGISHPIKKLELCALQAAVNLTLYSDEIFNSSYRWTDYQLCYNLTWPSSGNSVYLLPGQTIKFDLVASSFGKGVNQEKSGRVTIQLKYYSGPISSPRVLRKDHLIPFDGDSAKTDVHHHHHRHHHCLSYRSCLSCAGDTSCVWRLDTRLCIPRTIPIPSSNLNPLSGGEQALMYNPALPLIAHKSSLIIQPENCPGCSDMNFCEDCLDNNLGLECEWWDEEMSCQRLGRLENAIRQKDKCPESCSRRKTCSSCVDTVGKCVWCETRQECFIFSVYTSVYQFGQCFQWIDKADVCKRCDKQPTCESCVLNIGCGWSYDENGGSCSEGDFGGPYKNSSSSAVLNLISNVESSSRTLELLQDDHGRNKTWTYGECPDVNECELGIDDCHPNATCVNTPGSHACFCQPGFTGDGRTECEQTCREPCLHGTCSTEFVCECELGWTGSDCSEDCLCNNHSFCYSNGPGKCDKCQDFTTGENCELCAEGSYGNATLSNVGCIPCNCNGHGDVEVGLCDPIAGHCFCLNNTTGKDCSECGSGFYGFLWFSSRFGLVLLVI